MLPNCIHRMTERLQKILRFNKETAAAQQTPEALAANQAVAEQSLAHAEKVREIALPLQEGIWALEAEHGAFQEHQIRDKQSNSLLREVLNRQLGDLNPGWGDHRTPEERWVSREETIRRQQDAMRLGIRVRCTVQWGTGTPNNPLLMLSLIHI